MPKPCRIDNLPDGAWCDPVEIGHIMRHLQIERSNDCATLVNGERRDGPDQPWEKFRDYCGNSMLVYRINKPEKQEESIKSPKIKEGRAAKVEIIYPDKFDMNELATANPTYSKAVLYIRVQGQINEGKVKKAGEIKGSKGKAKILYEKTKRG